MTNSPEPAEPRESAKPEENRCEGCNKEIGPGSFVCRECWEAWQF